MDPVESPSAPRGIRSRRIVAAVLAALLLVGAAYSAGRLSSPHVVPPGTASAEAGFARDMQVHHAQAVDLAMIVRDETNDVDVRRLAYDIALGQSQGAGQLYELLVEWNLPQVSPEPVMTWMRRPPSAPSQGAATSHENMAGRPGASPAGGRMPGLATDAQLAALQKLRGRAAEREFLRLMIAHHVGGIEMARAVLARSDYPSIVSFARSSIAVQQADVTAMRAMLAARTG